MIDEGKHRVRGVSAMMTETANGEPQVAVELEFLDIQGKPRRTWFGSFTETLIGQDQKPVYQVTMESLYHLGWISGDLRDLAGIDQNEVSATVKHEMYKEKLRDKVAWINPLSSGPKIERLPENKLSAFAARMKGHALGIKKGMNLPSKPAAAPQQSRPQGQRQSPPPGAGDAWEPPSNGRNETPPDWMNE